MTLTFDADHIDTVVIEVTGFSQEDRAFERKFWRRSGYAVAIHRVGDAFILYGRRL